MDDIYLFLAHAVKLEADSARRFEELAAAMRTAGNTEVAEFFAQMAHFSRQHLAEATERSGFRPLPALAETDFAWPDGVSPETAAWAGVDAMMGVEDDLCLALESEQAGQGFYGPFDHVIAGDADVRRNLEPETVQHSGDFLQHRRTAANHAAIRRRIKRRFVEILEQLSGEDEIGLAPLVAKGLARYRRVIDQL